MTLPSMPPPEPSDTPPCLDAGPAELFAQAYDDLHGLARRQMAGQAPGHTLQATALVGEVFMKLAPRMKDADGKPVALWKDRRHLLGLASRVMRSVLVDHARRRKAKKRTAPGERVALDQAVLEFEQSAGDLSALDAALEQLQKQDPRLVELVELHYFGGLGLAEVAEALGTSQRSVERQWRLAKARLRLVLEG
jgi:RNA polymerase sigma factor (TIGR02999 family)